MTSATHRACAVAVAGLLAWIPLDAPAQRPVQALPPLPERPIEVPQLPADADKARLLDAYFGITGDPMMRGVIDEAAVAPAGLLRRSAGCPAAIEFLHAAARDDLRPYFEEAVAGLRGELLGLLDRALSEADLRAFLRFAATPDGQRHLNGVIARQGELRLTEYPAYEQDEALRAYHRKLGEADRNLDGVMADWQRRTVGDPKFAAMITMLNGQHKRHLDACRTRDTEARP